MGPADIDDQQVRGERASPSCERNTSLFFLGSSWPYPFQSMRGEEVASSHVVLLFLQRELGAKRRQAFKFIMLRSCFLIWYIMSLSVWGYFVPTFALRSVCIMHFEAPCALLMTPRSPTMAESWKWPTPGSGRVVPPFVLFVGDVFWTFGLFSVATYARAREGRHTA